MHHEYLRKHILGEQMKCVVISFLSFFLCLLVHEQQHYALYVFDWISDIRKNTVVEYANLCIKKNTQCFEFFI